MTRETRTGVGRVAQLAVAVAILVSPFVFVSYSLWQSRGEHIASTRSHTEVAGELRRIGMLAETLALLETERPSAATDRLEDELMASVANVEQRSGPGAGHARFLGVVDGLRNARDYSRRQNLGDSLSSRIETLIDALGG